MLSQEHDAARKLQRVMPQQVMRSNWSTLPMLNLRKANCFLLTLCIAWSATSKPAQGVQTLSLLNDLILDSDALLMADTGKYGRAINGIAHQTEALLTVGDYQYATWYHNGPEDEDIYLARRHLGGNEWEVFDSGTNFDNGDNSWDAHNVVSMGIARDGSIHLSYDHHNSTLRYMNTDAGAATGATWDATILNPEQNSLNFGDAPIIAYCYPRFVSDPNSNRDYMFYRSGGSGHGDSMIAVRDATTGIWSSHQFINGNIPTPYDDPYGNASNNRNAYLNGVDIDATGRMHTTWVWREEAGGSNHDIMYAYSDDGGNYWRNNAGDVIGSVGTPIDLNSPGIIIAELDRGNTLMNQTTQAVDQDGRVHIVTWHKTDEAAPVKGFTTAPAAYYHYYRDPTTTQWNRIELPTSREVGSRPDVAYDEHGNLYAAYLSPGDDDQGGIYTFGDLIITRASKSTGYQDWEIVYTDDSRNYAGEPRLDQQRLLSSGILSVFLQEGSSIATPVGTPLHVFEFQKLANKVRWAGNASGNWETASADDWDNDNDNLGDTPFANGFHAVFDDSAVATNVAIVGQVMPEATTFKNVTQAYTLTGEGIAGSGDLRVQGGASVTLAGGNYSYSGNTLVEKGALVLAGTANISVSPNLEVRAGATLDVAGTTSGEMVLSGQTLVVDGQFHGNLAVEAYSAVSGAGQISGNATVGSGYLRVGGEGLRTQVNSVPDTMIDTFDTLGLGDYSRTTVNDEDLTANHVEFSNANGGLSAVFTGSSSYEQVLLLRDDISLAVGDTLLVDVAMPSTSQRMDFGLAISETASPPAAGAPDRDTGAASDTRDLFDWASVSVRPNADWIRVNRSIDGTIDTSAGSVSSVDESSVTGLFIERNSETTFTVGYVNAAGKRREADSITFSSPDVASAIGFYADLRGTGTMGLLDNFRIAHPDFTTLVGESLQILGNLAMGPDAVLSMDILDSGTTDLLSVTGDLFLGGTLEVQLDPNAPLLQAGDAFQLLEFGTTTGQFDSFVLPALSDGLVWRTSNLSTAGLLEVVPVLPGDFNFDGIVDAADYTVWRNHLGGPAEALANDIDGGIVGAAHYATWRSHFGQSLSTSFALVGSSVPEPSTATALSLALIALLGLQRRRGFKRA